MRALALVLVLSTSAAAQPGPDDVVTHYYAQTLTVDATSIGLFVAGALSEGPNGRDSSATGALYTAGVLGAAFGSPMVHLLHGHSDRAFYSWGIRSLLGGLGATVGIITASCSDQELFCGLDRLGPGLMIGYGVASLIDASMLTEERRPVASWMPLVGPTRGGLQLGLTATW
jgi:hypothetical protein